MTKTQQAETGAKAGKRVKKWAIPKPSVYCGPSVRGVARQFTVYTGDIPDALADFIEKHPAANGLVVAADRFAETRRNLGKSGTAEAILYEKVKSEV